jgi:hypothetical protein
VEEGWEEVGLGLEPGFLLQEDVRSHKAYVGRGADGRIVFGLYLVHKARAAFKGIEKKYLNRPLRSRRKGRKVKKFLPAGLDRRQKTCQPFGLGTGVFPQPKAGSVFGLLFTQQGKIFFFFVALPLRT